MVEHERMPSATVCTHQYIADLADTATTDPCAPSPNPRIMDPEFAPGEALHWLYDFHRILFRMLCLDRKSGARVFLSVDLCSLLTCIAMT